MQQCLLAILVAATLLFTGCGGSGDSTPAGNSSIDFTATGLTGSRPSMLNLISSPDGTLDIPNPSGDEIYAAFNRQDGWALSQPIIMTMASADGLGLALPSFSSTPGVTQPVYLIEVAYDEFENVPTAINKMLLPFQDFGALASDKQLILTLKKPLNPGSYYTIVLTNRLVDSAGKALSAADSYVAARNSSSDAATDVAVKKLIEGQELIASLVGVSPKDIVLTDTFRTTSSGESLRMLKLAASQIITKAIDANRATNATDVWITGDSLSTTYEGIYDINLSVPSIGTLTQILASSAILPTPVSTQLLNTVTSTPTLTPASNSKVYLTTVKLPYFLGHPGQSAMAPKTSAWRGASHSLVSIRQGLSDEGDTKTAIVNALNTRNVVASRLTTDSIPKGELVTELIKLAGLDIQVPDGNGGLHDLDSEKNVTRFNALPALTIVTDIPLYLFSPVELTNVDKVVIFQHGITSSKEAAFFAVAGIISAGLAANQNIAVAAIDLPLHGQRSFPGGLTTTSGSPQVFANLEYLTTARDNLRQSSADLLGLRAALSFANLKNPATLGSRGDLKVSFVGHSLGGIVGTNFVAIANEPTNYAGIDNNLFKVDETVLGMAGSMIAHIMMESATFGPVVKQLVASTDPLISAGFTQFATTCEDSNLAMCFTTQFVTQQLTVAQQEELNDNYSKFAFAAQTVLDAADPVGIAQLIATTHPLLAMEVVGNKLTNLSDQVVPNAAGLAGTETLIRSIGLTDFTTTTGVTGTVHHAVRYIVGGHSSLLVPDETFDAEGAATKVMQSQMGVFFASNGLSLPTVNSAVICLDTAANCLP